MARSWKYAIKQLLPPVVFTAKRMLFDALRPRTDDTERAALKRAHDERNRNAPDDEFVLRPGLSFKLHPESREPFEAFCFAYPEMVAELDGFLKGMQGKQRFLDIGALHGIFSLVFTAQDPARRAVAVDASPIAFARLLYNIHKNDRTNIRPVECAVSDEPGRLKMHYEWEHAVAAGTANTSARTLSVPKTTGDLLCESLQYEPDLVKIDVEGHEIKVLRGLRATLERARPVVYLEVHPQRIREEGDRLTDLESLISQFGYRLESSTGERLEMRAIAAITADQRFVLLPN